MRGVKAVVALVAAMAFPGAATAQTPLAGTILAFEASFPTPPVLYGVDPASGHRTALSDLNDAAQGPKLKDPRMASGAGTVVAVGRDPDSGDLNTGLLVRIDPATGQRTSISNFSDPAYGPTGNTPFRAAVESGTSFLVTDRGVSGGGTGAALWRVDGAGRRTKLSDFNGGSPEGVALDPRNGDIYVTDAEGGTQCNLPDATDRCGALVRVDPTTGAQTLVNDFGTGMARGEDPEGIAFDPGTNTFLVADPAAPPGPCGCGEIFRVDPATGARTVVSDWGNGAQGPAGAPPHSVVVAGDGRILTDGCPGASGKGAICEVDPATGVRTSFGDFGDATLGPVTTGPAPGMTLMPVVPEDTRRPTSTTVSCSPVPVVQKQSTLCTATVTDTGAAPGSVPGGTVNWTSSVSESPPYGYVPLGPACTLDAAGTCQVRYRPEGFGTLTLAATYAGDAGHTGSRGSQSVQARRLPRTTITSGPSGKTPSAPRFTYTSDVPGSTFECAFDHEALHACDPAGIVRLNLPYGVHTFAVYATSPDGLRDPVGDSRRFDLEPETRDLSCSVDADLAVVLPALANQAHCRVRARCPAYSRCQITRTGITTMDMGRGVGWVELTTCRPPEPAPSVQYGCANDQPRRITWISCYFPSTGDPFAVVCPDTLNENLASQPPVTSFWGACLVYQEFNMPGTGRVTCKVVFQIVPATSLVVVGGAGGGAGVFLPAAGAAVLAAAGAAVPAAAHRAPPAFAPVHLEARRAGLVTFRLRLSRATKAALRRRHRLSVPLRLTFTPKTGKRVVRRQRLRLTLPTCMTITPPKPRRTHRPKRPVPPRPHRCAVKL